MRYLDGFFIIALFGFMIFAMFSYSFNMGKKIGINKVSQKLENCNALIVGRE
jgi:hypothetical protein